ncbi:MAG TPA: hypothetical protein VGO04_01735 [Ensifer sp.]|jgi:hypothetical protein|uniref:hypothetical protein n=1 Tax=Ensifer sp. TaxID=1872086 RepID=UPI002E14F9B9|nr:hypothetical protein [Ensifer sp.]
MGGVNDEEPQRKLPGPSRCLALILALLGWLPLWAKMLGFPFLPSVEWMATSDIAGVAVGLVLAAGILWLIYASKYRIRGSETKRLFVIFAAPLYVLYGYHTGKNIVVFAGPMIIALIAGQEVEIPFTVADAERHDTSRCRSPVELQDVPFLFNSICSVSDEFRQSLHPGGRVLISGRRTSLGVYIEGLRRAD